MLDFFNTEILNRPNDYFNETNLAKVYRIFADITDFIKDALGIGKLPTEQQQFQDLIDFLRIEYNLNLQQVALLKMLTQQLVQSPKYAEQFDKGDYMFLNNAPFRGAGVYLGAFGETLKPIFTQIKLSPSFKLARMH